MQLKNGYGTGLGGSGEGEGDFGLGRTHVGNYIGFGYVSFCGAD